jgi:iron complex outermembrane receptor protein
MSILVRSAKLSLLLLIFAPFFVSAEETIIEEIVVTGSYIAGTPEDAELPVDVINRQDLEEIGNPTITELVRNLGVASGNIGETNQFQAGGQANEGVATVNLRGLGSARTLVLINGRRHVPTETQGVDVNAIPSLAIGRLEILKDGAAALYGSDAIGGVVNFITRGDFEGFEVAGSFMDIDDSDGDFEIGAIMGLGGEKFNWTLAVEYGERSELPIRERDWALLPFSENSQGGFSGISNPGNILTFDQGVIPDANCEALGAFRDSIGSCGFQFTYFDNLIEDSELTKAFSELTYDISDTVTLHVEAMYSEVDLPAWKTSPSYPPQSLFGPDRLVLDDHPGLIDYRAQNPSFPQTGTVIPITRAIGVTGRLPGGRPGAFERYTETQRLAAGLDGTLFDDAIIFNISASWSDRERTIGGTDMFIQNMGFALRGLGGANCDRDAAFAAGTFGQGGCEYFNPFSNAIEVSTVNGFVNPQFNPAVTNSPELLDWLITSDLSSTTENELFVLEAVFSGETGIEVGGGNIGWALGAQSRRERYDFTIKDVLNRALNPCPWSDPLAVTIGFTDTLDCAVPSGQLAFLAAADEESTSRRVYGVFGELAIPLTEDINVQAAVRFEDYGGSVGSTIDPKIAFSWDVSEMVTLRGSASTTFRGPPQSFLSGTNTALQFIPAQNAFKAVDIRGNEGLDPETAVATNFGIIVQNENLYASLDWWSFDFQDAFQTESAQQIVGAYEAQECFDGGAGIGTSSCDALRAHIFPFGTALAGLQRIDTNIINGEDIKTSGIDYFVQYDFPDVAGGMLSLGSEGTYVLEYESDDFVDINGSFLAPGGDFVGLLNDGDPFTPKPELKANVFVKYANGAHRVQVITRYVDSYKDVRPGDAFLAKIDDHVTVDVHYNLALFNDQALVSLSIFNLTDEDPPQASTDLNYDAFTHSAFGRMIKLGVRYSFNQ